MRLVIHKVKESEFIWGRVEYTKKKRGCQEESATGHKKGSRGGGSHYNGDNRASLPVTGYGMGKYLEKRLNISGTERIEKTKLAKIN